MEYVIIDPASTEFNRGSFCYLPYILYAHMKKTAHKVTLLEDFTVSKIDQIPRADVYFIALWSYPQIDACLVLRRYLRGTVHFFGYRPLIEHLHLPLMELGNDEIENGIRHYVEYYREFQHILLSDCDMHLRQYEGQVYPLFTSYGCDVGCTFCPSFVNCEGARIELPVAEVKGMLDVCQAEGYLNIHFTDEDFFWNVDRAAEILRYIAERGNMNLIALGSIPKVQKFVDKYGLMLLGNSGVRLIEVGIETVDVVVGKGMKKVHGQGAVKLAERMGDVVQLFWLCLTFFPGETVSSLNSMGTFLKRYGHKPKDLYERIATNSTEGGLGQFFQPYHGAMGHGVLEKMGRFLSERPIRLIPSYLPYSFLFDMAEMQRELTEEDEEWFRMYNLEQLVSVFRHFGNDSVYGMVQRLMDDGEVVSMAEAATFLAIAARLGVII